MDIEGFDDIADCLSFLDQPFCRFGLLRIEFGRAREAYSPGFRSIATGLGAFPELHMNARLPLE